MNLMVTGSLRALLKCIKLQLLYKKMVELKINQFDSDCSLSDYTQDTRLLSYQSSSNNEMIESLRSL